MTVVNHIRTLLKPWWAKLCAVVILMVVGIGWYASWVYVGWAGEREAMKEMMVPHWRIPYNPAIHHNVLPDWLIQFPEVARYGGRMKELSCAVFIQHGNAHYLNRLRHLENVHLMLGGELEENSVNYFKSMQKVKTLGVVSPSLPRASWEGVSKLKQLETLHLTVGSLDIKSLSEVILLPRLKKLSVYGVFDDSQLDIKAL